MPMSPLSLRAVISGALTLTLALILAPPPADAQTPTCVKWGWGAWEVAPRYEGGPPVSAANTCIGETRPTHRRRPIPVAADGSSPCNGTVTVAQPPVLKTGRNASWSTTGSATVTGTKDCRDTRPKETFSAKAARAGDEDVCKFDDGGQGNAALLFNKDAHNGSQENKPCILRSQRHGRLIHLAWLLDNPAGRDYDRGYGGYPINLVSGSRFEHWLGKVKGEGYGDWCHFDEEACRYQHYRFKCTKIMKDDPDNPGKKIWTGRYKSEAKDPVWKMNKAGTCPWKYYTTWIDPDTGNPFPAALCTPASITDKDGGDGCKDRVDPTPTCDNPPCDTPVDDPDTNTPPPPTKGCASWSPGKWYPGTDEVCQGKDFTQTRTHICDKAGTPGVAKPADDTQAAVGTQDPATCCDVWDTGYNLEPAAPGYPNSGWQMYVNNTDNALAKLNSCTELELQRRCKTPHTNFSPKKLTMNGLVKDNHTDWTPALDPATFCKGEKKTQTRNWKPDAIAYYKCNAPETRELEGTKVCAKEDGVCGAAPNHAKPVSGLCDAGTMENYNDKVATKITWDCKGVDGGKDSPQCETPVTRGVCAASPSKVGDCDVGNAIGEDSVNKIWYCEGTPAGVDEAKSGECSLTGQPVSACGSTCPTSSPPIWTESGNRCCATWTNGNTIGCFSKDATSCAAPVCGTTLKTCSNGLPVPSASIDTWMCISMGPDGKGASVSCSTTAQCPGIGVNNQFGEQGGKCYYEYISGYSGSNCVDNLTKRVCDAKNGDWRGGAAKHGTCCLSSGSPIVSKKVFAPNSLSPDIATCGHDIKTCKTGLLIDIPIYDKSRPSWRCISAGPDNKGSDVSCTPKATQIACRETGTPRKKMCMANYTSCLGFKCGWLLANSGGDLCKNEPNDYCENKYRHLLHEDYR